MKTKSVLALLAVMLLCFALTACGTQPTDYDAVLAGAFDKLFEGVDKSAVTDNLTFPDSVESEGCTVSVSYKSGNATIISRSGIVSRSDTEQTVTITVTLEAGGSQLVRTVDFTVSADTSEATQKKLREAYNSLFSGTDVKAVTGDIPLMTELDGITVKYESDKPSVIDNAGHVTRTENDETVRLSVTLSLDGQTLTNTATLTVLGIPTYDPIGNITETGKYSSRGKVIASISNTFILADGTGKIPVYSPLASNVKVGESYVVTGEVIRYANAFEFQNITLEPYDGEIVLSEEEPAVLTPALAAAIKDEVNITCRYIEVQGEIYKSGSYIDMRLDGINGIELSPKYSSAFTDYLGKHVILRGICFGVNGGSQLFIQTLVTEIRLRGSADISPSSIQIVGGAEKLNIGSVTQFSVKYQPDGTNYNKAVSWSSSDNSVLSVDGFGVVTAKAVGQATLSAKTANGKSASLSLTVAVLQDIAAETVYTDIFLKSAKVGSTCKIVPLYLPENANTGKKVTYSTGDASVASVDENGVVTGISEGKTTLTITLENGYTYTEPLSVRKNLLNGYENTPQSASATVYAKQLESDNYKELVNAATVLRNREIANSPYKRDRNFNDFPLYKNSKGTKNVRTTEELYSALQAGFVPAFPVSGTKAEYFFGQAKEILRNIVTDDMSDIQKLRAIYDYISENGTYDNSSLKTVKADTRYTFCIDYLEGFFEEGRSVCAGFSRVFVVLCRIEGIEAVRVYDDGHAWDDVKLDGKWYTFCTTWSQIRLEGSKTEYVSYLTFGARLTYCNTSFTVSEASVSAEILKASANGYSISDSFKTQSVYGTDYDYYIDSQEELNAVFGAVKKAGISGNYYIPLASSQFTVNEAAMRKALNTSGISGSFSWVTEKATGVTYTTVIING